MHAIFNCFYWATKESNCTFHIPIKTKRFTKYVVKGSILTRFPGYDIGEKFVIRKQSIIIQDILYLQENEKYILDSLQGMNHIC